MPTKDKNKLTTKNVIKKKGTKIFDNTEDNMIYITESKAKLIYNDHIKNTPNIGLFFTILGFFVSFLLALITADFKDFLGFKSYYVQAFFVMITIASAVWCIILLIRWIKNKKKYSVTTFINALKDENDD